jgi:hypothetical protein
MYFTIKKVQIEAKAKAGGGGGSFNRVGSLGISKLNQYRFTRHSFPSYRSISPGAK